MTLTRADGQVEPLYSRFRRAMFTIMWSVASPYGLLRTPLILPGLPEPRAFAAATSGAWRQKTLE